MTWLTGWRFRKSVALNGVAGAGTNYTMPLKVYYGNGVDGTENLGGLTVGKVYCNSRCRTDFGDLRITDNDGETLLNSWLETKVDSNYAIFWFKVTDNLDNNQSVYVYYGKADATKTVNDLTDGQNAFLFFSNKDDYANWVTSGAVTVTSTADGLRIQQPSTNQQSSAERSFNIGGVQKYALEYNLKVTNPSDSTQHYALGQSASVTMFGGYWITEGLHPDGDQNYYITAGWVNNVLYHPFLFTTYYIRKEQVDETVPDIDYYFMTEAYSVLAQALNKTLINAGAIAKVYFEDGTVTVKNFDSYCKWIRIRKWTGGNEPTYGAWGNEETICCETFNLVSELLSPRFQYLYESLALPEIILSPRFQYLYEFFSSPSNLYFRSLKTFNENLRFKYDKTVGGLGSWQSQPVWNLSIFGPFTLENIGSVKRVILTLRTDFTPCVARGVVYKKVDGVPTTLSYQCISSNEVSITGSWQNITFYFESTSPIFDKGNRLYIGIISSQNHTVSEGLSSQYYCTLYAKSATYPNPPNPFGAASGTWTNYFAIQSTFTYLEKVSSKVSKIFPEFSLLQDSLSFVPRKMLIESFALIYLFFNVVTKLLEEKKYVIEDIIIGG